MVHSFFYKARKEIVLFRDYQMQSKNMQKNRVNKVDKYYCMCACCDLCKFKCVLLNCVWNTIDFGYCSLII
jgi:hypothetical protein